MKELQILAFQRQLQLALDYGLPVNIHSRYAGHYCTDTVISMGLKKVQMHAYDGSGKSIRKGLAAGFFYSIPSSSGSSQVFQRLIAQVPIDRMLLETDSPDMGVGDEMNTFSNISFLPLHFIPNTTVALQPMQFTR